MTPVVIGGAIAAAFGAVLLWFVFAMPPRMQWTLRTGRVVTDPIVADDALFFATSDNALHAVDLTTGEPRWRRIPSGWHIADGMVASDANLYFTSGRRSLHAVRLTDGDEAWRCAARIGFSPPTLHRGKILVADGNSLRILDAASGEEHADQSIDVDPGLALGAAIVVDDVLYCGYARPDGQRLYPGIPQAIAGGVCAIDLVARELLWITELGHLVRHRPIARAGLIIATEHGVGSSSVHALHPTDGQVVWSQPGANTPTAAAGSLVCTGTVGGTNTVSVMRARHTENGESVWAYELSEEASAPAAARLPTAPMTAPVRLGDRVFFGARGHLVCLDAESGTEEWTLQLGGTLEQAPIAIDSTVYVSSSSGRLHAIEVE